MADSDHRDSLAALAESINETGRMARANVSLTLIGALYLALTLLSANDENLLRNAVVTLPQLEAGISLKLSYIFAPVVFLYLHLQTLFLLVVLARKVRTYEISLAHVASADGEGVAEAEYRDSLSAVSLVQGLQGTGPFAVVAKSLTWIGTVGIPLLLLFLIDTSFLRYQSLGISSLHHLCFVVDLACVWAFWCHVFSGHSRSRRKRKQDLASTIVAALCSCVLVAMLLVYAWPVRHQDENNDVMVGGQSLPSQSESLSTKVLKFNVFDDVLCRDWLWRGFCRTLKARGVALMRSDRGGGTQGLLEESNEKQVIHYRRLYGLDLRNRSLISADLVNAYLFAAQLSEADLRGANLSAALLHGADLAGAKLNGASLAHAELHSANLSGAKLHNVGLNGAELHGTNLSWAKLNGAKLIGAQLHGANLSQAELRGANLSRAKLHGADLSLAELHDAKLIGAQLHGANLILANLQGANLTCAELVGANLKGSLLHNAKLVGTSVMGTEGQPSMNQNATIKDVVWTGDELPQPAQCSDDPILCHLRLTGVGNDLPLAWNPELTLTDHLLEHAEDDQSRPAWLPESSNGDPQNVVCH